MALNELVIRKLARAIANAEGFNVPNSRPARNHNPGNLTKDITATGIGMDPGPGVSYVIYKTDADGWDALEKQVRLMFAGGSHFYFPSMTIAQMAEKYTGTQQSAWARNVAVALGVSVDTRLDQLT